MEKQNTSRSNEISTGPLERKKRKREYLYVGILGVLFLILTYIEFRLFDISHSLPFVHSIFFIGLVNFNIILFLLLIFFIFRNVVKVFTERRDGIFGGTLKSKLVAAFVSFSVVPTLLMFLISVFYINNSFDKWFSEKMSGVLKSSLEVTNEYYSNAKKRNYHFARLMAEGIRPKMNQEDIKNQLNEFQKNYKVDSIEYYPDFFSPRIVSVDPDKNLPELPEVSLEFKKKGMSDNAEGSTIHHFAEGNLIRVIVPVQREKGAIVVSSFIPLSLISKIEDIASAYQDFRNINPIEYPIKTIYLIILILMTLFITLGATWFGFHLAKHLSVPLQALGEATRDIAKGDFKSLTMNTGSDEINELIANFNNMSVALESSENEIKEANFALRKTLAQIDEYNRYIEVVLSNVSTGVITVDQDGIITMINRHAENLLNIKSDKYVGRKAAEALSDEYYKIFDQMLKSMKINSALRLQKEVIIRIHGRPVPVRLTVSVLKDDKFNEIGKVFVFDDMSDVVRAQRAAAWTEVARRIAHEIKNPLTPIKLSAQRLQKKFGTNIEDEAFAQCTNMIIEQVDDLKHLVNEFSNYARLPQSRPTLADLNKVIEQALLLFQSANKNISIHFSPNKNLPAFLFDPDQMKRVITNLMDNSISALSNQDDGEILVETGYNKDLKLATICVKDNGPGVPAEIIDRVFEPYVTTKSDGTGLGLAIVKRTVEDHNGYIRFLRNKPTGTKMLIELPVLTASTEESVMRSEESTIEGWI
ncbi:MAG: ATP-binding protein [Bdellovibrionales bacterium]